MSQHRLIRTIITYSLPCLPTYSITHLLTNCHLIWSVTMESPPSYFLLIYSLCFIMLNSCEPTWINKECTYLLTHFLTYPLTYSLTHLVWPSNLVVSLESPPSSFTLFYSLCSPLLVSLCP